MTLQGALGLSLSCVRVITPWLVCLALVATSACKKSAPDSAVDAGDPIVSESRDDLVLAYMDQAGDFHVVSKPSQVPEKARDIVRVTDPTRELGGELVFVSDLRDARPDGSYPVRIIKRSVLEGMARERRAGRGPTVPQTPPTAPPPNVNGRDTPPVGAAQPSGAPDVIIYGAEWCGPCHQAAAFLKSRNVPFVEKDIESDAAAAREMKDKLRQAGIRGGSIPVLDVRGKILVGFSQVAVSQALR